MSYEHSIFEYKIDLFNNIILYNIMWIQQWLFYLSIPTIQMVIIFDIEKKNQFWTGNPLLVYYLFIIIVPTIDIIYRATESITR